MTYGVGAGKKEYRKRSKDLRTIARNRGRR